MTTIIRIVVAVLMIPLKLIGIVCGLVWFGIKEGFIFFDEWTKYLDGGGR